MRVERVGAGVVIVGAVIAWQRSRAPAPPLEVPRPPVPAPSVEAAVDRIGFDTHRLSKRAKDLGSAAVLVTLAALALVWIALAGPAVLSLLAR